MCGLTCKKKRKTEKKTSIWERVNVYLYLCIFVAAAKNNNSEQNQLKRRFQDLCLSKTGLAVSVSQFLSLEAPGFGAPVSIVSSFLAPQHTDNSRHRVTCKK